MDRTVPKGAALLLDFIRATEVGTEGRDGYDVIYGFNQSKLPKPITQMTVAEVQAGQPSWTKRFGSSASGAYQFMLATLKGLRSELGLRDGQVFDADLQDRLGYHLLKRRGYEQFMAGAISRTEFGDRLAMEWASFPVLRNRKGAHRQLTRGQSYYAGDGVNKALVEPETVEAVLDAVLGASKAAAPPIPVPMPPDVPLPDPEPPVPPHKPSKAPAIIAGLIVLAVAGFIALKALGYL